VVGQVHRQPAGSPSDLVSKASLPTDATGSASWNPTHLPGGAGDRLTLTFLIGSTAGSDCPTASEHEEELASLVV
jgi:hypothetical protein